MSETLIEVKNLVKHFPINRGILFQRQVGAVKAVNGLSFSIRKGETLGLVGESGCGKSTTGRLILRLIEPTSGQVSFEGRDVLAMNKRELRELRRDMQIVFQNPYASLDPRMTVGDSIAEPLRVHGTHTGDALHKRVRELLDRVGLNPIYADRYPHEFSGGQRQRIGIARALAINPRFIVADEPVSALDVSVQAQVLNLLDDLQAEFGLTYLFIAHNLSTVQHISDRVAVMYLGSMMELASSEDLYANPKHPYTQALLSAVPVPDPIEMRERTKKRIILQGDIPSPTNPPSGCVFHTRCPHAMDACRTRVPAFQDLGNQHFVACHLYDAQPGTATELTRTVPMAHDAPQET
ncbi:MAG: dipeptide ABC transporter ATP-binding protein [Candidatus Sericytochromatia bacterium]|nr:dipeptide ABC transporter ATP-binding protein [Candidatus Sericytochromatia bacterium]